MTPLEQTTVVSELFEGPEIRKMGDVRHQAVFFLTKPSCLHGREGKPGALQSEISWPKLGKVQRASFFCVSCYLIIEIFLMQIHPKFDLTAEIWEWDSIFETNSILSPKIRLLSRVYGHRSKALEKELSLEGRFCPDSNHECRTRTNLPWQQKFFR